MRRPPYGIHNPNRPFCRIFLNFITTLEISRRTEGILEIRTVQRISYYELLQATHGYEESNLLGTGSCGSVYKGILKDGMLVAVKMLNLQVKISLGSFERECEVFRNVRHRNLPKVLGSCYNNDFKALVLEFMPDGSLEKWLYSHNYFLDIMQRLNRMIDVARAIDYFHNGYLIPVIHCDLKPSNVLLDAEMVAHVTDFSIAKLMDKDDSIVYTRTLATFGYIAPESPKERIGMKDALAALEKIKVQF
ncbi:receptor kinase-like protein Xa21 [Coffea eugenioides]|uniref:receptor kinase-like protein Xa21 n=1 Tax=Coffea eugenioides TaxID=49369 RepID=UPI000F608921|nr:receptor kinase-like protein Xa21 [Coffea eugenioides]